MSKVKELQETLDEETWETVEVPLNCNAVVEELHNPDAVAEVAVGFAKQLVSDDVNYWATKSLLVLTTSICSYTQIMEHIPEAAFDAFCNLIELIKVTPPHSRCSTSSPASFSSAKALWRAAFSLL